MAPRWFRFRCRFRWCLLRRRRWWRRIEIDRFPHVAGPHVARPGASGATGATGATVHLAPRCTAIAVSSLGSSFRVGPSVHVMPSFSPQKSPRSRATPTPPLLPLFFTPTIPTIWGQGQGWSLNGSSLVPGSKISYLRFSHATLALSLIQLEPRRSSDHENTDYLDSFRRGVWYPASGRMSWVYALKRLPNLAMNSIPSRSAMSLRPAS